MNTDLNYEIDVNHFRLKSLRRKKRMQYGAFEKKLRKLDREEKELFKKKNNLGWVELNPPVTRGWKRGFVLRDDVARSKDADFFESILKKINTEQWSWRKDFKIKKKRKGVKIRVDRQQHLYTPDKFHFNKLSFTEAEARYFLQEDYYDNRSRQLQTRFVFMEQWRFVLRVRPNVITKTRARDEALDKRLHELSSYFDRTGLYYTKERLIRGHYKWRYREGEKVSEINRYKNKPLEWVLDDVYN